MKSKTYEIKITIHNHPWWMVEDLVDYLYDYIWKNTEISSEDYMTTAKEVDDE